MGTVSSEQGFKNLHNAGFNFKGVFQCRLPTDMDPSNEPRGRSGWTFAYADEPDLDRVIRFNNPTSTRPHVPNIGVIITDGIIDNEHVSDSLLGHSVNLGSESYFDGRGGADGHEPIANFEFHMGDNKDYIFGESEVPPRGNGGHTPNFPLPINLEDLRNSRIEKLKLEEDEISKSRLQNILRSLWAIYNMEVTYNVTLIIKEYNPLDSNIIRLLQENNIPILDLKINFYGYDGDGLVGYVDGSLMGQYR